MKERKSATLNGEQSRISKRMLLYCQPIHSFTLSLFRSFSLWLLHSVTLSLFIAFPALAQERDGVGPDGRYYPVQDLRAEAQVYDESARTYVPFIDELHADLTAISVFVDLESNRHYKLLIATEKDGHLFIDAALNRNLVANRWVVMDIDSLYRLYRQPQLFITLYGSAGLTDKQLLIGYPKSAAQKTVVLADDLLSVRPRPLSVYTNFFGLGLLFLLATHAFLFNFFRRAFVRFYDPFDLLGLSTREESFLISRPLSSTNLLFILNLSFVLAYMVLFVHSRHIDLFGSQLILLEARSLPALLADYLLITTISFLLMLSKYAFLSLLASLYKLDSIANLHFFRVIQSSLLFFTGVALLMVLLALNVPDMSWLNGYLLVPFIAFYLGRLALLYVTIRNTVSVKNLYLFSYLCIVELIPLIIGVRFAL